MKLEPKHIIPYLLYDLKLFDKQDESINTLTIKSNALKEYTLDIVLECLEFVKPILSPISDTTKEILHNGKKVIIEWDGIDENDDRALIENIDCSIQTDLDGSQTYCLDTMHYYDFQILIEHHFDVFGLIPKGLAIDKNTI